ncbi:hypothetical protein I204_03602 [Kwoniella mangroviensis CBS 8886]|uniref:uncharacterized protein n=1 Tax=Kwoniella mangroviensis CBS 8507 TaxID=1296122 RepID=UPI00080D337E|nr:uncharacterized protein I203_00659 [Kwoniella mangroviensis CBS 8507]OCF70524.1 hypothetical protein I203_00659 [Kwoniella mangroviensis CBS 8507]OCF76302.1 hypothetical protein I204_03602 [Kwoniella mangroviensis CBS 8886]
MQSNDNYDQSIIHHSSDLASLQQQVNRYSAIADEVDTAVRNGRDPSVQLPEAKDLSSLGEVSRQNPSEGHQASELDQSYAQAVAELRNARTMEETITQYHTKIIRACESMKACLEASQRYIASEENIPSTRRDIEGFEYPDHLGEKWREMYEAASDCDYDQNASYVTSVISLDHPLKADMINWDEIQEEYFEAQQSSHKLYKMQAIMGSKYCRA